MNDKSNTEEICNSPVNNINMKEQTQEDMIQDRVCTPETGFSRPPKRDREGSSEEDPDESLWQTIKKKEKKPRHIKIENDSKKEHKEDIIYISSKDILPKQFALARLFKANDIRDITRVKYLNPYKVRLEFSSRVGAEKLKKCQEIINLGWRIQKATEISFSYGIIRDVDMELTEQDILNNISCPDSIELLSIKRLSRRNKNDVGWSPCETVRLCFKGPLLPPYVYVCDIRVKVESYVYPVTQCTQCWKIGHITKTCPSKHIICPKCGGKHENCDTQIFKCVNCSGSHIALAKTCPVYMKEKKIRELMAENNCTYSKAREMVVIQFVEEHNATNNADINSGPKINQLHIQSTPTFATVTKSDVYQETSSPILTSKKLPVKKLKRKSQLNDLEYDFNSESETIDPVPQTNTSSSFENGVNSSHPNISFSELLMRLREIVFMKNCTFKVKVKNVIKIVVEWLILLAVDNITDWPQLKIILDLFNGK